MQDQELKYVKESIMRYNSQRSWHLIDSVDGVLVYSDKRGVNLSRVSHLVQVINSHIK